MTCSRWIRVCVDMLDHPVVGINVPPPRPKDQSRHAVQPAMAWLDMLCAASWKERKVHHKDKVITLKRGEFIAGRAYWAKRWNWGEQAVRSFFARLVKCEMIAISNQSLGHTANIVSICNYDLYQGALTDSQPEEKPELNQCSTSAQPETNQTVYRNNREINNIPSVTTVVPVAARAEAAAAKPKIDFRDLHRRLIEAGGDALNRTSASLETVSDVIGWIETGADLDKDILPVIRAKAARARPQSIRSWQYFATAVADAVEKRKRGLPTVAEPEAPPVFRVSPETVRYAKPALDDSWLHELRAKNEQRRAATC